MALAADVRHLPDKIVRELLLDHEIPVLVIEILATPVDRLRAEELILRIKESSQRIGQGREVGRRQRITRHGAFGWIAEIVVLVSAVVDSVAAANRGPAMKH